MFRGTFHQFVVAVLPSFPFKHHGATSLADPFRSSLPRRYQLACLGVGTHCLTCNVVCRTSLRLRVAASSLTRSKEGCFPPMNSVWQACTVIILPTVILLYALGVASRTKLLHPSWFRGERGQLWDWVRFGVGSSLFWEVIDSQTHLGTTKHPSSPAIEPEGFSCLTASGYQPQVSCV